MENVRIFDKKKYMWDGKTYISESEAISIKEEYEKNGFNTRMFKEEEKYFLFTRKVVTEVIIENL